MKQSQFKLNSIFAAMLVASTGQAFAAEADKDKEVEVIQVTGIFSSLSKATAIKRDASGVVDAISAEDIGKFPDTNLAESLQRITGVSIDRSNNEGNQVTVRGFGPSFNLVTLNGRQMPNSSVLSAGGNGVSRSFNFKEIAAETVSGVEVHKTGKAHISSGGVGATVNINTARPFDFGEFKAFASAKGVFDTSVEKGNTVTPEISGMVSQVFADGKFGVLFSASHSERHSRRDRIGTDGWVRNRGNRAQIDTSRISAENPDASFWTPWTAAVEVNDSERERQNAQLVLQAAPTDNIVATLDYTISRFEEVTNMNRMAFWFDSPFGEADENGTVWNPRDPDDELNFWAWQYYEKKENDSLGLNVEWQVTDALSLTLDYHDSTSHSNPNGQTAETLANLKNSKFDHDNNPDTPALGVDIGADFVGDIPTIYIDDSKLPGGGYAPENIVSDLYQQRGFEMENNIKQFNFSGKWENLNDGALTSINFGIQKTEYTIDTYRSGVFQFRSIPTSGLNINFVPRGDTGDQFSSINNSFPQIAEYSALDFIDIVTDAGLYAEPNIVVNGVSEDTVSAYLSFDFATEFNNMPVNLNVGVRYEDTDVTAYTIQEGLIGLNYRNLLELQPVFDGIAAPQNLDGQYSRILPNFDFSISPTDEIVARFSYSRTIGRPNIGSLFPGTNLTSPRPGDPFRASQGNPNLLPITSDNFDISFEYYFDDGSYVSAAYFKKFVENFIVTGTEDRQIFNVNGDVITDPSVNARAACPDGSSTPNPACLSQSGDPEITWEVSTPVNLQDRKVDGWELAAQYMFGDTGFGGQANYTIVDSDEKFDVFDFDQSSALNGLSDSANLVGFYEKDQLQVRLAYNWRDDFLQGIFDREPRYVEAYGQWDISVSYDINDEISVFVDGINLTDETTRTHGRFSNQLLSAEQYGPRYTVGIRGTW